MPRREARAALREGMRAGDLAGLVLPLLSVDEYESKIDPAAVAVGFYVHDESAAADLNRFVQKSAVSMLNCEVSPAPDQHGFFLVFVDFLPDARIADHLARLLREIEPLCGIGRWKMRVRRSGRLQAFAPDAFRAALRRARAKPPETDGAAGSRRRADEAVLDFLRPSQVDDAFVCNGELLLESRGARTFHRILACGPLREVAGRFGLQGKAAGLGLREVVRCRRLEALLGEGWLATETDGRTLLEHTSSEKCLLLGPTVSHPPPFPAR